MSRDDIVRANLYLPYQDLGDQRPISWLLTASGEASWETNITFDGWNMGWHNVQWILFPDGIIS